MRILMLCRSMPWHLAGGLEHHAWDLARGLANAGDEVHILTTPAHPARPASEPPPRVHLHALAHGKPGRYGMGAFAAFARAAAALDRQFDFDVIHAQGFAANAFPRALAPKLAITVHGTLTSETELYPPLFEQLAPGQKLLSLWRHKARLASAPLFRHALRMASVLLVDSDFTRRELESSYSDLQPKIRVVPLGIHPDRMPIVVKASSPKASSRPAETNASPHSLRLLSISRLTRSKGLHIALEAASLLQGNWHWEIAGTGPEEKALRQMHRQLNLGGRVELLGGVEESDLQTLRAESHCFVFPELGYPAFGLVALEAMLAGLPVVASDHGAIPEVVRPDCGWTIPDLNPQSLASILQRLIQEPSCLAPIAATCRHRALERFSFDSMISQTRKALGECELRHA